MKRFKVMTIVGTRPEIIRLSRVINLLDKQCDHALIHTGQNYDYELNEIFFKDLKLKQPKYILDCAEKSATQTIGTILKEVEPIMIKEKPDAVLVLGDTNSCLSLIAAKKLKIPTFHMEAGNRCFDFRVPEEVNRKIADHTADVNLTYSNIAREYLLKEGLPADLIIKTGSPMKEVVNHYLKKANNSNVLKNLNLKKNQFFLVSAHREENIESSRKFNDLVSLLNWLAETYSLPILVSTHPRTKAKIDRLSKKCHKDIVFHKPLSYSDYLKLQLNAKIVLSDSGTITEESSILNFPAINIRESHERPEGMEEGAVILTSFDKGIIKNSIDLLSQKRLSLSKQKIVSDYDIDNVSMKVLKIILSYSHYINRVIWNKNSS